MYNITPKDIAALTVQNGIGCLWSGINIPLTNKFFSQETANPNPIYYVVGEKVGLYG
jgi:hypothetical protein